MNLSKIVNGKLLPELRELGIPCPDDTCDVLKPATEYHEFIIHPYDATLHISKVTPIWPTARLYHSTSTNLPFRSPESKTDYEKKILQIEDPELFQRALAIITIRWRAMQRYEDICTLDYIEGHSQSERALFSQYHINRLLHLAGRKPNTDIPWISLSYEKAVVYIKEARQRMKLGDH